uniref:Uncharacterized protein n=1 Tax=Arundo donax TaxID=35708 RepID=A0A0A8ZGU2_ARUDO
MKARPTCSLSDIF